MKAPSCLRAYDGGPFSALVITHAANLIAGLRVKGRFLHRYLRIRAWPPVGDFPDGIVGLVHDLLSKWRALLSYDVSQLLALVRGMRRKDAVRNIGAEDIEIAILEATIASVEHVESLRLVVLYGGDSLDEQGFGLFRGPIVGRSHRDCRGLQDGGTGQHV